MDKKISKETLSHIFKEINFHDIATSVYESDLDKLVNSHGAIHEFMVLPTKIVETDDQFYARSAFLLYHWESFDRTHLSFLSALMGHYNAAYTLLRNALELIIKGAFWERLAHKKYREKAESIKRKGAKIGKSKKTLIDWLNEIIMKNSSIKDELENTSAGIFDKTSSLTEDEHLRKIIPDIKTIVRQLLDWKIFDPIQNFRNPVEYVYGFYKRLSADVHVIPDKTDIGRRLLSGVELFETEVMMDELNEYYQNLLNIMDIGIVVELNILEDYITQNDKAKNCLKERLPDITMMDLPYASTKIEEVIRQRRVNKWI